MLAIMHNSARFHSSVSNQKINSPEPLTTRYFAQNQPLRLWEEKIDMTKRKQPLEKNKPGLGSLTILSHTGPLQPTGHKQ